MSRRSGALAISLVLVAVACGGSGAGAGSTSSSTSPASTEAVGPIESSTTTVEAATITEPATTTTQPATTTTIAPTTTAPEPACDVGEADGRFHAFYTQQCEILGVSILASSSVQPEALDVVARVFAEVIGHRPDLIEVMIINGLRIGIMADDQVSTDLPEHSELNVLFPETDWDGTKRGLSATPFIPLASAAEENLLCFEEDAFTGESIWLHELGQSIRLMGIDAIDPTFTPRLADAFGSATGAGLWTDTFAGSSVDAYWAEGVQSYFDANLEADPPNGIHNFVNSGSELAEYDPALFALVDEVFAGVERPSVCQASSG